MDNELKKEKESIVYLSIGNFLKHYKVNETIPEFINKCSNWEEIPDEDLWEDGELSFRQVALKIYDKVCCEGNWKLLRRKNG